MNRGGKRKGSGRKRSADPTVVMRVPQSKVFIIKEWLKTDTPLICQSNQPVNLSDCRSLLINALSLKANAGGRIKTEIRKALELLQP